MAMSKNDATKERLRHNVIVWVQTILDRKDWTKTDLARKSELSPTTLTRLMNSNDYTFTPTLTTLKKISDGSGFPIPKDLIAEVNPLATDMLSRVDRRNEPEMMPAKQVSVVPAALQSHNRPDVVVHRPSNFADDTTLRAVFMPDNALDPWVTAGSLLYVTQSRDPRANDIVVVTLKDGRTFVRLMTEMNEEGLVCITASHDKQPVTFKFEDIAEIGIADAVFRH